MDKGQKVLFAMYKGKPSDEVMISAEDLALAKAEGYLFDYPKQESHADTLDRLKGTLAQIDPKAVADAFLFSLSTRRLEYRSALGSYYFAKAVPAHAFMNSFAYPVNRWRAGDGINTEKLKDVFGDRLFP